MVNDGKNRMILRKILICHYYTILYRSVNIGRGEDAIPHRLALLYSV